MADQALQRPLSDRQQRVDAKLAELKQKALASFDESDRAVAYYDARAAAAEQPVRSVIQGIRRVFSRK